MLKLIENKKNSNNVVSEVNGLSMRNYSKATESLPETFEVPSSNVSIKFK